MRFRIIISPEAEKILDRLDRSTMLRIRARLGQLADDPFDPRFSSPLTQRQGARKSRVGGWRILYRVDLDERILFIVTIDTRGQVYKRH